MSLMPRSCPECNFRMIEVSSLRARITALESQLAAAEGERLVLAKEIVSYNDFGGTRVNSDAFALARRLTTPPPRPTDDD